jgi:ABC-type transporter Mla maintaining outer membrane lipid asymmetry permease subunit MlaE
MAPLRSWLHLNSRILYWIFLGPLQGQPWRISHVFEQIVRIGVQALPMAALTAFSVGFTLAMQGAEQLGRLGRMIMCPIW